MKENRAIILPLMQGVIIAIVIFFVGFGVLCALWFGNVQDPQLPGLFSYQAAYLGDSICLPLLVGALFAYIKYIESIRSDVKNRRIKDKSVSIAISIMSCIVAIVWQLGWLISDSTKLNWTIPRLHHFNFAGWYHAVYFVAMFGIVGYLFTEFIVINKSCLSEAERTYVTILQVVIWFSGTFYLFLNALDNFGTQYTHFFILTAVLIIVSVIAYLGNLVTQKSLLIPRICFMTFCSGIFTAYALANVINNRCNPDGFLLMATGLLITIFIVPNVDKIGDMVMFYIIIGCPTLLLQCSITSTITIKNSVTLAILSTIVPCFISIGQKEHNRIIFLRKSILFGIVILCCIALLIINYSFEENSIDASCYEALLGLVLTFSIPQYIKMTFSDIKRLELTPITKYFSVEQRNQIADKTKIIMYVIYAMVFVGAFMMLVKVVFEPIPLTINNYINRHFIYGAVCVIVILLMLYLNNRIQRDRLTAIRNIFLLILFYIVHIYSLLSFNVMDYLSNQRFYWYNALLCLPIIGICIYVPIGCSNNTIKLRGQKIDKYIIISALLFLLGIISNTICVLNMIAFHNRISIYLNIYHILVSAVIIPVIISWGYRTKHSVKYWLDVMKDGFLYGIIAILSESLTIFFLPILHFERGQLISCIVSMLSLITVVTFINWPLQYCITNNIQHIKIREKEIIYEEKIYNKENYLNELAKHLAMQNIFALLMAFPYSFVTICQGLLKFLLSDEQNIRKVSDQFIPKRKSDIE